ncbi:MAG: DUF2304 domain-containing protein [Planctomycetota bacterium]|jgi:hypothetical protein
MSKPEIGMQGIIIINIMGLGLIILILNLIRTRKLYVGYGALWLLMTLGMMAIISIPPVLNTITRAVGATFPASALSLMAFALIFVILIFFSLKLSTLSERVIELTQALALKDLLNAEAQIDGDPSDNNL